MSVRNVFDDRAYASIENNVDVLSPNFFQRDVNVGVPLLRQVGVRLRKAF